MALAPFSFGSALRSDDAWLFTHSCFVCMMLGEACNRRKAWVERMEINGSTCWSARMQLKKGRKRILGYYETEREAKRRCAAAATADCILTAGDHLWIFYPAIGNLSRLTKR